MQKNQKIIKLLRKLLSRRNTVKFNIIYGIEFFALRIILERTKKIILINKG